MCSFLFIFQVPLQSIVNKQSINSQSTVNQQSINSQSTDNQQAINRQSKVYQKSINSHSTVNQQSIYSQSIVNWQLTINSQQLVKKQCSQSMVNQKSVIQWLSLICHKYLLSPVSVFLIFICTYAWNSKNVLDFVMGSWSLEYTNPYVWCKFYFLPKFDDRWLTWLHM